MTAEQQLWMTEPQDVLTAIGYIRNHKRSVNDPVSVDLVVKFSRFIRASIQSEKKTVWPTVWLEMGQMALTLLEQINGWSLDGFVQLLLDKHKRYGLQALTTWGHLGMAIRVDSKCDRLDYMTKNASDEGGDESVTDTIQDVLGYSILGLYMCEYIRQLNIERQKPKIVTARELPSDVEKIVKHSDQANNHRLRLAGDDYEH